ncbi:hypothetical protein AVEN_183619-1 [Araneus ventricosus]|uniref:Reverse transcriptase Ty1/copia-type domain-containing protein n=1 Tax=Araneus ventricosus TaxID=182803 RepID=A0A4Y2RWZ5_ARAVE|nr:hypothetical protein AVEN_183619-1 [Araneus ventricosus]
MVEKKRKRIVARVYEEKTSSKLNAPVARLSTVRKVISCALQNYWSIRQLDIPSAFLNGEVEFAGAALTSAEHVSMSRIADELEKNEMTVGILYKITKGQFN